MIYVVAKRGLNFKCQGQRVTEDKPARVSVTHDILKKLQAGTLIKKVKTKMNIPRPPVKSEISIKDEKKSKNSK